MRVRDLRELSSYARPWFLEEVAVRHFDALLDVAERVPDLLDWMERYRGGDSGLSVEEFYIRTEAAQRALERLDAVR